MSNTITTRFARFIALPAISAGILGAAAFGAAGVANAAATTQPTGPGYSYTPQTIAKPAAEAQPGWRWHHGVGHLQDLQPGYHR